MKTILDTDKNFVFRMIFFSVFLFFVSFCMTYAQAPESNTDKSLSPYFYIQSDDAELDCLPLKSTKAEVNIGGVIADVKVTQEYKNSGMKPLEAIYVFPASTRAAVYSMQMTIGERVITAIIKEREQARKDYEDARRQGKGASLLEQERPNVFQMNVANIMPGDLIKVVMKYTELLVPESGMYEFVYPTVVGPRYSNKPGETVAENGRWVANPYMHQGEKPMNTFDIKVNLNAGMPVKDAICQSHDMDIQYTGQQLLNASLKAGNEYSGNRDFIFRYRLQGQAVHSGLLLYKGTTENFFLAMLQPPQKVVANAVPPREYVFIVDVSGSMNGFPLDISKKLLRDLIGKLRSSDCFNVILFAGASNVMSAQSIPATQENIDKAIGFIERQEGGGGTELLPALRTALALKGTENYSRTFVLLTDGYVDVEKESFDLVRKNLNRANFFAFGIGTSVNRFLIEGLAHAGAGEPFIVERQEKAAEMALKFRKYIELPVLTNISVAYEGFQAYDVEPVSIPDVFAERPVIIYGKWKGMLNGKIKLAGMSGSTNYTSELVISPSQVSEANAVLKYLWARKRIQILDDYTKAGENDLKIRDEVTKLGLKYNLLTAYTSFVAVDSDIRNKTGQTQLVKQPLPLPQGVSNYAVGGGAFLKTKSSYKSAAPVTFEDKLQEEEIVTGVLSNAQTVAEEKEVPLVFTEQMPEFPGGNAALQQFISQNLRYPQLAKEKGISGRVIVQFVVDKSGTISDIKVVRGIGSGCDEEAVRLVKMMGKWQAGKQNGKPVKVSFIIPIVFSLTK